MPIYQYVLAAVDLGENSATVLQHAAPLAQSCNARLTVLHVVKYSPSPDIDHVIPRADETESRRIQSAKIRLQELLEREALSDGVGVIVVSGRPESEIVRTAEREQADLIVVGAHGRHGLGGLLLGSTTDRVLHHATCDVLTVR